MKILAKLQHMAASEIMNIIPPDLYDEIKAKDDHPLFQAYVVGHEGEARATFVGIGQKVMTWFSSAINKLWKKLQYGTKIFHGHNLDSSHAGRESIGEVVGKTVRTVKDKMSAIAIAYIYPEYSKLPLDVASIEADIVVNPDINVQDDIHDVDVGEVTGIALSNSALETPGFAGATLLSQIQAFAKTGKIDDNKNKEGVRMTLKEIKAAIDEGRIQVDELYSMDEIGKNKTIQDHFQETGNIKRYERLEKKFEQDEKKWADKEAEYETKIKELGVEGAKIKANDLFDKKMKDRKLTDKQVKFVKSKQPDFTPKDIENLDKEVDEEMDSYLDKYKVNAEIFEGKTEEDPENKGGGEPEVEGGEGDASHIPD